MVEPKKKKKPTNKAANKHSKENSEDSTSELDDDQPEYLTADLFEKSPQ